MELLVNKPYMVLCVGDARLLLFSFELSGKRKTKCFERLVPLPSFGLFIMKVLLW